MQDNPNITDDTGSNTPYLEMDRDDWEIAFEAFKGTGYTAIRMGMNLRMLYKYLDAQLFKTTASHGSARSRDGSTVSVNRVSQSNLRVVSQVRRL